MTRNEELEKSFIEILEIIRDNEITWREILHHDFLETKVKT